MPVASTPAPTAASEARWSPGEAAPALPPGAVHLWSADLDRPPLPLALLAATLSVDERARAGRFVAARDRDRFVAARGLLRTLLGAYAARAPAALHFVYWEHGKPALAAEPGVTLPCFNLAHTGARALIAVAADRELGVDIEAVDGALAWLPLAQAHFAPAEVDALRARPPAEQAGAFYRSWALKEAWAKARGDGLAAPLASVDVSSVATGRVASVALPLVAGLATPAWTLQLVEVGPGHAAALAVPGDDWRLTRWSLVAR